jgi:hypothetical protein
VRAYFGNIGVDIYVMLRYRPGSGVDLNAIALATGDAREYTTVTAAKVQNDIRSTHKRRKFPSFKIGQGFAARALPLEVTTIIVGVLATDFQGRKLTPGVES